VERPFPPCQRGIEPPVGRTRRPKPHHGGHIPEVRLVGIGNDSIAAGFEVQRLAIVGGDHPHDSGLTDGPLHLEDRPVDPTLQRCPPHSAISTPQEVAASAWTLIVQLNWWCARPEV